MASAMRRAHHHHHHLFLLLVVVSVAVVHTHAFYLPGTQPVDFMPGDEVTLMVRHSYTRRLSQQQEENVLHHSCRTLRPT